MSLPKNAVVWAEIPVADIDRARGFYRSVLGQDPVPEAGGPNPMLRFACADPTAGLSGHLYPGTPAPRGTGATIHLAVAAPLEDAMARVAEAGGEVVGTVVEIPAGRFCYALDPDGNSVGLFEA